MKLGGPSEENELARKIKNKLRMKKISSSNSGRGGIAKTPPELGSTVQQGSRQIDS
jgi:hypothetical protein